MEPLCPLCETVTVTTCIVIKNRKYYRCAQCDGVFMDSSFLHVFFYSTITAEKIRDQFGFRRVDINGNLIIFSV